MPTTFPPVDRHHRLPLSLQQSNVCARSLRRRLSSGDPKERTNMENNYPTEPAANGHGGKSVGTVWVTKPKTKKAVAAKGKSDAKLRARAPRSTRGKSASEKLVCRYCGSDDLAPSFKKRRDARCRACFKKRYRSKKPDNRTARTNRKAKVVK